jgi:hypothetical protein
VAAAAEAAERRAAEQQRKVAARQQRVEDALMQVARQVDALNGCSGGCA